MWALKHWKSQEVASYSPAYQFSFLLLSFFLFMQQAMFIDRYDYHSHPSTFYCIFHCLCKKKKAVQELLRRKAVCLRTDIFFQTILRCLAWLRHRLIMRTSLLAGNNTEKFAYKRHDMNILWPQICQFMCPLHKSYCTQHLTFLHDALETEERTKLLLLLLTEALPVSYKIIKMFQIWMQPIKGRI